ncbi:hypothetical protein HN011_000608 [Eciton burchellii]|jgi:hypothetical protein|nr:hypothetical protein HN011_000608 [Eciton burchellii]
MKAMTPSDRRQSAIVRQNNETITESFLSSHSDYLDSGIKSDRLYRTGYSGQCLKREIMVKLRPSNLANSRRNSLDNVLEQRDRLLRAEILPR